MEKEKLVKLKWFNKYKTTYTRAKENLNEGNTKELSGFQTEFPGDGSGSLERAI